MCFLLIAFHTRSNEDGRVPLLWLIGLPRLLLSVRVKFVSGACYFFSLEKTFQSAICRAGGLTSCLSIITLTMTQKNEMWLSKEVFFCQNIVRFLFILLNMPWKMKHLPICFSRAQLQNGILMSYSVFFFFFSFSSSFLGFLTRRM